MNWRLNGNQLKIIAVMSMFVNYVGKYYFSTYQAVGFIFRTFGQIASPIACYLLAQGFFHTSSRKKYGMRLFFVTLISHFAYQFAEQMKMTALGSSTMTGLFAGFLVLVAYNKIKNKKLRWTAIFFIVLVSGFCEQSFLIPLLVLGFWIYRDNRMVQLEYFFAITTVDIIYSNVIMIARGYRWYGELWKFGILLFIPFFLLYSGKRGEKTKWKTMIFYIIYPMQFLMFGIISRLI